MPKPPIIAFVVMGAAALIGYLAFKAPPIRPLIAGIRFAICDPDFRCKPCRMGVDCPDDARVIMLREKDVVSP